MNHNYLGKNKISLTIFPYTIYKPSKCNNEETISWPMLQGMLKLTPTEIVTLVKEFFFQPSYERNQLEESKYLLASK